MCCGWGDVWWGGVSVLVKVRLFVGWFAGVLGDCCGISGFVCGLFVCCVFPYFHGFLLLFSIAVYLVVILCFLCCVC